MKNLRQRAHGQGAGATPAARRRAGDRGRSAGECAAFVFSSPEGQTLCSQKVVVRCSRKARLSAPTVSAVDGLEAARRGARAAAPNDVVPDGTLCGKMARTWTGLGPRRRRCPGAWGRPEEANPADLRHDGRTRGVRGRGPAFWPTEAGHGRLPSRRPVSIGGPRGGAAD